MLFLSLLFLFVSFLPALADDFSGDNVNNQYFQTTSFNVENFPNSCTDFDCISYDEQAVLGENTTLFLDTQNISTLTDFGGTRRIPRVSDRVEAPPGTKIDIIYYYSNTTNHHVNISKIAIPFTKNEITQGNLLNLVSFPQGNPESKEIPTLFNGNNLVRNGYMKEYTGTGLVLSGEMGAYKIDEIVVKDPIRVDNLAVREEGEVFAIKVWIQNESSEYLNDVVYEHGTYSNTFDLLPLEEIVLEYSLENTRKDENSFDLGNYKITNPNIKTECAVQGTNYYNWTQTNAVSVFGYRDDGGWINGAYIQPSQESFCITRIPYKVYSSQIVFEEVKEKESIDDYSKESDEEVFGISDQLKELPKTAKSQLPFVLFLVVDVYLWYSFFKIRRKYESKNTDTRICSEGSKNPC